MIAERDEVIDIHELFNDRIQQSSVGEILFARCFTNLVQCLANLNKNAYVCHAIFIVEEGGTYAGSFLIRHGEALVREFRDVHNGAYPDALIAFVMMMKHAYVDTNIYGGGDETNDVRRVLQSADLRPIVEGDLVYRL
jgi:hypothetical protein